MPKVRDKSLDAIKGFLILVVILCHNSASNPIFLNMAHPLMMGIFFMVSGFLYSQNKSVVGKLRSILYPFAFFCLVSVVWRYAYGFISHEPLAWRVWFRQFLLGQDWGLNIPLWFLVSLSQIILITTVLKSVTGTGGVVLASFLLMVLGLFLRAHDINPIYLSQSFTYLPFFVLGMEIKKFPELLPAPEKYPVSTILFISVLIWLRCLVHFDSIYMKWGCDGVLVIVLGYLLYKLFKCPLVPTGILEYYGKNSLVVLCMHILILDVVWRVWWHFRGGEPAGVDALLQTIIVALLLIPFIAIYKKYLSSKLR